MEKNLTVARMIWWIDKFVYIFFTTCIKSGNSNSSSEPHWNYGQNWTADQPIRFIPLFWGCDFYTLPL